MEIKYTARGFASCEFDDNYGNKCNIQKSSRGDEPHIWFGSKEIGLRGFIPFSEAGWRDVSDEQIKIHFGFQDIVANNRMHLNREQVKALIPILQKFVDTGEIE